MRIANPTMEELAKDIGEMIHDNDGTYGDNDWYWRKGQRQMDLFYCQEGDNRSIGITVFDYNLVWHEVDWFPLDDLAHLPTDPEEFIKAAVLWVQFCYAQVFGADSPQIIPYPKTLQIDGATYYPMYIVAQAIEDELGGEDTPGIVVSDHTIIHDPFVDYTGRFRESITTYGPAIEDAYAKAVAAPDQPLSSPDSANSARIKEKLGFTE